MHKAIVVRGRLRDGRIVELEELVDGVDEEVEVLLRLRSEPQPEETESPVMVVKREHIDPLLHPERLKVEVIAERKRNTGLGSTTEMIMARRVEKEPGNEEEEGQRDTLPDDESLKSPR